MKELLTKARRGDAGSQMWLAAAYEQGWFGKKDIPEALKWYRKSAKRGNADAQNELGRMYEEREGVKQNYFLAARCYRRAAEHVPDLGGAGQGRNNLGMLYLQAYMWFSLFGRDPNPNLALAKELWIAKRSAVTKNGALLGGVGLNTITFSIQHEDLGGQEPEGSWSSHVYIKDRRKVDQF